jgi:hypothetical protein
MVPETFPVPGPLVREALGVIAIVRSGDEELIEQLGDLEELPRPWEPDTCSGPLLAQVWLWCDQVVQWINHEYAWRPTTMIPSCWPAHPHLTRELPALACQRHAAREALDVTGLEEWHRYTLPTFIDRMIGRLGESTCRDGRHIEWPAGPRHAAYTDPNASRLRRENFGPSGQERA